MTRGRGDLEALADLYGPEFPVERGLPSRTGPVAKAGSSPAKPKQGEPHLNGSPAKVAKFMAMNEQDIRRCVKCPLSETRIQTVFGEGNVDADIVFIGEGPGVEEDKSGRPFVGPAGRLLDKMITAMGLSRQEVFICNAVKCHPRGKPPVQNRPPQADEIKACRPYLEEQLKTISPKIIVSLGRTAADALGLKRGSMASIRGETHEFAGFSVRPTYHPSALLRPGPYQKTMKKAAWEDLKDVLRMVGRAVPGDGGTG